MAVHCHIWHVARYSVITTTVVSCQRLALLWTQITKRWPTHCRPNDWPRSSCLYVITLTSPTGRPLARSCVTFSPCRPVHNNNCQICWSSRYLLGDRIEFHRVAAVSPNDSQWFCRYTPAISVIFADTLTLMNTFIRQTRQRDRQRQIMYNRATQ